MGIELSGIEVCHNFGKSVSNRINNLYGRIAGRNAVTGLNYIHSLSRKWRVCLERVYYYKFIMNCRELENNLLRKRLTTNRSVISREIGNWPYVNRRSGNPVKIVLINFKKSKHILYRLHRKHCSWINLDVLCQVLYPRHKIYLCEASGGIFYLRPSFL